MIPALLSLAAVAAAAPVARQSGPTDVQILNYALTLEHLENNFYKAGTTNFTAADFTAAGASPQFFTNLKEIGMDEQTHVDFLTKALGDSATAACTYAFPVTDAKSFLAVAQILEGVGVSAYLGAAQYIMNKDYLTAAGSILTVEARHSAYIRDNSMSSPFPSPFDIPLDFDEVYSLAAQFIVSCPDSNPKLPVKAFPAVSVMPANPVKVGDMITVTPATAVTAKGAYFITTTGPVAATLDGSGASYTVTIPDGVQNGQEYLVLTGDSNKPTDDNIVAGPAIVPIADYIQAPPASGYGSGSGSGGVSQMPDGQPTTGGAVSQMPDGQPTTGGAVSQMPDGQPTTGGAVSQMPDGQPTTGGAVSQMPDGQPTTGGAVSQMPDGQPTTGGAVSQMPDGQPTTGGAVSQMPDGQPTTGGAVQEMPDGQPVSQIGDGQIQVHPVGEMPDGQPTAPPSY